MNDEDVGLHNSKDDMDPIRKVHSLKALGIKQSTLLCQSGPLNGHDRG